MAQLAEEEPHSRGVETAYLQTLSPEAQPAALVDIPPRGVETADLQTLSPEAQPAALVDIPLLLVYGGVLPEEYYFNGLGPALNNLIEEALEYIVRQEDLAEKVALTERLNEVLIAILNCGLEALYGEAGLELSQKILGRIQETSLEERIPTRGRSKDSCLIVYPNTFGNLDQLADLLPVFAELGITKLHILPFFDHNGDGGYAVNYHSIESPLQLHPEYTLESFERLVAEAKNHGISLVADVVLNHMSINSPILQEPGMMEQLLLNWPEDELPFSFVEMTHDDETGGSYAVLKLKDTEEIVKVLIMFPQEGKENPVVILVNGRAYYFTFYDFQIDLNFKNPLAFELIANIVLQATEMLGKEGQLRLDAIPFIGKEINGQKFQNLDNDDGYKIITLLKLIITLAASDMKLVAEASRPLLEIIKYLMRVGAAYDFISLPYFLLAVAEDKPELFFAKLQEMIDVLGLAEVEKLVFALQTHDDYPLAEMKDAVAKQVWEALKKKNAVPFGQENGGEGTPKGAAVRLAEICDRNPAKIAASVLMTAFGPHGDLFSLYGTEIGLGNSDQALIDDAFLAETEHRGIDTREVIRPRLDIGRYKREAEASETFSKISTILHARKKFLPEKLETWQHESIAGVQVIQLAGEKEGQHTALTVLLNYSDQPKTISSVEGQVVLSSLLPALETELEPWGYRVVRHESAA